jgi:hypothetical protein
VKCYFDLALLLVDQLLCRSGVVPSNLLESFLSKQELIDVCGEERLRCIPPSRRAGKHRCSLGQSAFCVRAELRRERCWGRNSFVLQRLSWSIRDADGRDRHSTESKEREAQSAAALSHGLGPGLITGPPMTTPLASVRTARRARSSDSVSAGRCCCRTP